MQDQEPTTEEHDFVVPKAVVLVIGLGTFVIGGLLAKQGAEEGLEIFEEKVNNKIHKIQARKNATPPAIG